NVDPPAQILHLENLGSGLFGWTAEIQTDSGGNWLSVTPISGQSPATITVSVNTAGVPAGAHTATITFFATAGTNVSNSPQVVRVGLTIGGAPEVNDNGAANGASFLADGNISPGAIVSMFGSNFSSSTANADFVPVFQSQADSGPEPRLVLPTALAATQVFVNGSLAPLFFVSPTQINFQLPTDVTGNSVDIQVAFSGVRGVPRSIHISPVAPGIFTQNQRGTGAGAILNQNSTMNSAQNPADVGSTISI